MRCHPGASKKIVSMRSNAFDPDTIFFCAIEELVAGHSGFPPSL
jgi:hypothetical protein